MLHYQLISTISVKPAVVNEIVSEKVMNPPDSLNYICIPKFDTIYPLKFMFQEPASGFRMIISVTIQGLNPVFSQGYSIRKGLAILYFYSPLHFVKCVDLTPGFPVSLSCRPDPRFSTPGMSSTMALCVRVILLNSVDLPTLDLPIIAITGLGMEQLF